jgi:DNA-binding MarR family transcriptional regulator
VQELHLTDAGREVLHQADILVEEVEKKITTGLGRTDTVRLRALLEKVAATAQEM